MADNAFPFARALILAMLCLAAVGCRSWGSHSCRQSAAYAAHSTAEGGEPLKIPPDLDAPDTTQALHIPDLKAPAPPPRQAGDPCLDEPPSFVTPKPASEPAT